MRNSVSSLFLIYLPNLIFANSWSSSDKTSITNIHWALMQMNGIALVTSNDNPMLPTLKFEDKTRIFGLTGCYNFSGIYQLDETKITITTLASSHRFGRLDAD